MACLLCRGATQGTSLCHGCRISLPWQGSTCSRCALPMPAQPSCSTSPCPHCPDTFLRFFQQVISPLRYEAPCSTLINAFKHDGRLDCGYLLGTLLAEHLVAHLATATSITAQPDVIVPVPLHWRRLQQRGFNQSHCLAQWISALTRIPILPALSRHRRTQRQQQLGRSGRYDNLHGAFHVSGSVSGAHVALVDDVITTGSTAATLAVVLHEAGARSVSVWTVARTLPSSLLSENLFHP